MKLLAIPFGEDGFAGDSCFVPSESQTFEVTEKTTLDEALAIWRDKFEEDDADQKKPCGFWCLTPENLRLVFIPFGINACNDTQHYTIVRISKMICEELAEKKLGSWPL